MQSGVELVESAPHIDQVVRPTGVSSSSARQDDDPPPQKRPKLFANYLNAREQHDAALSEVTIADLLAKYWRYRPWLWFVGFLEGQAVTVWQADTCSTAHFCCACLKCIIERVLVMGVLCCRCAHTGHVCLTSYCQSLCFLNATLFDRLSDSCEETCITAWMTHPSVLVNAVLTDYWCCSAEWVEEFWVSQK